MHATREFMRGPNNPPMKRGPNDTSIERGLTNSLTNKRSLSVPIKRERQLAITPAFKRVRKGD